MRRLSLLFLCVILISRSFGQYADLGTGALKNQIWWFDWANFNLSNGASKTFTTADGLTVTINFSKVSGDIPAPEVMNTWSGAVLHFLYDFSKTSIKPAFLKPNTNSNSYFTLTIAATRGGMPTPFTFVAADAEGSDNRELIRLKTNGSNWQTIDFFRNSSQTNNPLQGCGTQTVAISETYGGSAGTGQNPVVATVTQGTQPLIVDASFERTVLGGTAVAFGIFAPIDRGDSPTSYGSVQHLLSFTPTNACSYLNPLPKLAQSTSLKLGAIAGDADGAESLDDNAVGTDEEAINSFPSYDGSGSYNLTVPTTNNTGTNAFLRGWFDYNKDGVFSSNEAVTATVADNASSATLQWTNLPSVLSQGPTSKYAFRFRLSSDLSAIQNPTGAAIDGEVEDYLITFPECILNVKTIENTAICVGEAITLATSGASAYTWKQAAGLSTTIGSAPIATPTATTEYIVTGTDNLGCTGKDTVLITVHQKPIITKLNDVRLCEGDSIQLTASSITTQSYEWSPTIGLNNSLISNPLAFPRTSTKYFVSVKDNNGCSNVDSIAVNVFTKPVISIRSDTTICKGSSLVLSTQSSNANSFEWLPKTGLSNSTIPSPTAMIVANTQYILTATGAGNCYTKDTITINTLPLPLITKSADTTVCQNGTANLMASGGVSYEWFPSVNLSSSNSASTVAKPISSTRYYVTVLDKNGCTAKDSVNVIVQPIPIFKVSPAAPSVCLDKPITLLATGGTSYSWLSEDNREFSTSASIIIRPLQNTTYRLAAVDHVCNVRDTLSVPVTVNERPNTSVVKSNDIDCSHGQATLTALGGIRYAWDRVEGVTDLSSTTITVANTKKTTFYVTITDQNGCSNRDSVTVNVDFELAKSLHLLPSAFTPNGDGKNDCFGLKYWGAVQELSFSIFNRWGEKVFSTSDSGECWDGRYNGKQQAPGLFVYIIKAKSTCGDVEKKGTVMLIR